MQLPKDAVSSGVTSSAKPISVGSLATRNSLAFAPRRPEGVAGGAGPGAKGKGSYKGAKYERGIMFGVAQNAAVSVNLEIQKCAAPAVAAIALGGQAPAGAVRTMMLLLTTTQHIQVRGDCMDALSSLVSKDVGASGMFLSLGGMEIVLGFVASSSSRLVHRKALDLVEALVRHAPKTVQRFSDQVLAGLVCYIRNNDHFTSQHAATKLVRLTRAANAAGEVWSTFVDAAPSVCSCAKGPPGTLRQLVLLLQQTICADASGNMAIESLSRPEASSDAAADGLSEGGNGLDIPSELRTGLVHPHLHATVSAAEAAAGGDCASMGGEEAVPEDVTEAVQEMVRAVAFSFGEVEDAVRAVTEVLKRQRMLDAKPSPQPEVCIFVCSCVCIMYRFTSCRCEQI
jgi:hypothetical protein